MKYIELAQNMDCCPENDKILSQRSCAGCQHYVGFFVSDMGLPCVKCKYGIEDDETN